MCHADLPFVLAIGAILVCFFVYLYLMAVLLGK